MRVVVDAAHGAASYLAPALFERLGGGRGLHWLRADGRNINLNCGSLHSGGLQRRVLETGAEVGVAFDGDADRALFVSAPGQDHLTAMR